MDKKDNIICPCCGGINTRKPNKAGFIQDAFCRELLKVEDGKVRRATLKERLRFEALRWGPENLPTKGKLAGAILGYSSYKNVTLEELSKAITEEMDYIEGYSKAVRDLNELTLLEKSMTTKKVDTTASKAHYKNIIDKYQEEMEDMYLASTRSEEKSEERSDEKPQNSKPQNSKSQNLITKIKDKIAKMKAQEGAKELGEDE